MNTEPKHQFEHEEPTVIHHPDEDMTILGRWLYNGMQQGARFWLLLGGGLAALIAFLMFFNTVSTSTSPAGQAWTELVVAKTPVEMVEIAETFPDTPATPWAKIQAASNYYLTAGFDLPDPAKRDTALPQLKKALDLFEQVAKSAPKGSHEGLVATMGLGRTHEVRNELPEAIKAYDEVVAGWPKSAEAKEAATLAKRLKEPEAVAFYKAFYDYKAPTATLPGALPANHPSLNGPMIPAPALPGLPGTGSAPGSGLFTPPSPTTPLDLPPPPTPPSTPAKTEAPKAEMTKPEAPKVEAPKAEPKPAPKPEAPKVEAPKPAPKPEAPKAEAPKPEAPKPAPKPEAPKAEMTKPAPKAEAPKAEAPKPAPKPEAPKAEEKAKAATPKGELPDDVFSKPK